MTQNGSQARLEGGREAAQVLGQAAGVVGSGAADALDHVNAIAAFGADGAVVLWAAEVRAALRHLRVYQPVHTPTLSRKILEQQIVSKCSATCCSCTQATAARSLQTAVWQSIWLRITQVEMQYGPLILSRLYEKGGSLQKVAGQAIILN